MHSNILKLTWPHVGNDNIKQYLEKIISNTSEKKDLISGAYIFNGPDNLGKTTVANYFAKILLCSQRKNLHPCDDCNSCRQLGAHHESALGVAHGDYHAIGRQKDKKNISIEQVRELIYMLNMSSFMNSYKVGIIKHAETMSNEAMNAVLKTLEEPKQKVVIILVTNQLELLPETILSRSKILNFHPVKNSEIYNYLINTFQIERSVAKTYSRMCLGRPALAIKFHENKDFFDKFNNNAELLIDILDKNLNEKLSKVDKIIDAKLSNQENIKKLIRVFEVWESVLRDVYLSSYNNLNLLQNENYKEAISGYSSIFNSLRIVDMIKKISRAKGYLASNVSVKGVLDNLVIQL